MIPDSAPMSAKGYSKKQSDYAQSVAALSIISEQKESPEKKYFVSEEDIKSLQDLNFQCYIEAVDYDFDEQNGNMVPKCQVREIESTPTEDNQFLAQ